MAQSTLIGGASADFLRGNARWLLAGFLLALASSPGQTFFIAMFSEPIRAAYGLTVGEFGAVYMLATLASAATILQLGRLADRWPPQRLAAVVVLGLAAAALVMAGAPGVLAAWPLLALAIYLLRLFGQGMCSHLSQTLMARWFNANRGKALAVAALGYPTGEALAPLAALFLIGAIGWRGGWAVVALGLALVVAPLLLLLLSKERRPKSPAAAREGVSSQAPEGVSSQAPGLGGRHWTRGEVARSPLFWFLFPGVIAPGFLLTVLFFLPGHIAETKGWEAATLYELYWVFALVSVAASIVTGALVDRIGLRACLPFYQLPMAAGLVALAVATEPSSAVWIYLLCALTAGAAQPLGAAIWAEFFGTRNLGAIKALAHSVMVFATAAGPGLAGALVDAGAPFEAQAWGYAAAVLCICALYGWLVLRGPARRDGAATSA